MKLPNFNEVLDSIKSPTPTGTLILGIVILAIVVGIISTRVLLAVDASAHIENNNTTTENNATLFVENNCSLVDNRSLDTTVKSEYFYSPGMSTLYTDKQMLEFIFKMNSTVATKEAMEILQAIDKYSFQYNLPEIVILALIKVESNFDAKAVSNAGAQGLMQIMASVWFNETKGMEFENLRKQGIVENKRELFDIDKNIHAGCYILNQYRNTGIEKGKRNPIKYALNRYFGITKSTPSRTHYEKMIYAIGQMFTVWVGREE